MGFTFDDRISDSRRLFGSRVINQRSSISIWIFYAVLGFVFLHVLNWSAKCGPLSSGAYRDQCARPEEKKTKAKEIMNEAFYHREQNRSVTPYVDLKDEAPKVPPGHGRSTLRANVRSEPSMVGEVIANLDKDQVVKILETQGGWVRVRYSDDSDDEETGWVWKDLLKP